MSFKKTALFIDRDGVINQRIMGGYVQQLSDFIILPGVIESFRIFSELFFPVVVITNQQGIGKGLMTEHQLSLLHDYLYQAIQADGGRLDGLYFCPHLAADKCDCRKPKVGMYHQALKTFPELSTQPRIMVGDTEPDMIFGDRIEALKVMITDQTESCSKRADMCFSSLRDFAAWTLETYASPKNLVV